MKNVLAALSNVQNEINVPKNQYNGFGKYHYRSCEDIIEGTKSKCFEHGLVLLVSDSIKMIGDRYYVEATAQVIHVESGENFSVTALAREEESKKGMDGAQVTGASSSYARKYALNGLFAIDDTKDADTKALIDNVTPISKSQTEPAPTDATKVSVPQLEAAMKKANVTKEQIFATYKKDVKDVVEVKDKTCTDLKFLPQEYKLKYFNMCK